MSESIIVKLETPLPCATYNAERNEPCGKPATVAYAYERRLNGPPPILVEWVLQPICRECVEASAALYKIGGHEQFLAK